MRKRILDSPGQNARIDWSLDDNMNGSLFSDMFRAFVIACGLTLLMGSSSSSSEIPVNLKKSNLVAWCIVPFDATNRSPSERSAMLADLGLRRSAYDWRARHIPEFEEEILQYRKHGIEYFAFWGQHEKAFKLFTEHDLRPQIWQTLGTPGKSSQAENILAATDASRPLAIRAAKLGCRLGLYNHGGWGGEPGNLVAVCQALHKEGHRHVGIVYNWHHGHERIKHWAQDLKQMLPYLHCINLNGMNTAAKPKILPIGQGEHDLPMLRAIISAGYQGPIGILDHQSHLDTREALQDNLEGLAWLTREIIEPGSGGPQPTPKASPIPK